MRYDSAAGFRTALEARLRAAQHEGAGVSRLRKRVAFERFLARLCAVAPDAWVLKGGFALELRLGDRARTTKDIDVDWRISEEDAVELLIDAAALVLDDRFEFALSRSGQADERLGRAERWAITATLAGREFERLAIDVEYATAPVLEPETIVASQLLGFAGMGPVAVPALAIEQHAAEKLHAYTRRYARDARSSRVKDLVDLAVIAGTTVVDARRLEQALTEIFDRRDTHSLPDELPAPPSDWEPAWRGLTAEVPAADDLLTGFRQATDFLEPVLNGTVRSGTWKPDERSWIGT